MNEIKLKKHSAIIQMSNINAEARKVYNYFLYKAKEQLNKDYKDSIFKTDISSTKSITGATNNKALKKSILSLLGTVVEFNTLGKDKNEVWSAFALLSEVEIDKGVITYTFPKKILDTITKPLIYGIIDLAIIKGLNSKYSIALYELIEDYKKLGKRTITIEDFRELMGLTPHTYKNTNDLKRRVIDISIAEIKEKTPFNISYKFKKLGRVIESIEFSFINIDESTTSKIYMEKSQRFEKFRNFLKEEAEEMDIFTHKDKVVSIARHPIKGKHLLYFKNNNEKEWMSDKEALETWRVLVENRDTIRDKILEQSIWY